jgi:hypothetical protein
MAEQTQPKEQTEGQQSNGGANGGQKAVRAAAIAAATGAAAIAARKALSGRSQSGGEKKTTGSKQSGGGGSMITTMATSGWSAARDSLLPFAEEAAGAAGDWVGRNGPDYVKETIVPRFIDGFESARSSSQKSD